MFRRTVCGQSQRAALLALERGELNLNVFEGAAAINLLDVIAILSRAVALFTSRCIVGIRANEDGCRELAAGSRFKSWRVFQLVFPL